MQKLKTHQYLLQTFLQSNLKLRKAILNNCNSDFIKTILEIILNTLKGNLKLKKNCKSKLKKHKKILRHLIYSKRTGIPYKRSILVQRGSSFIPIILSALVSSVIGKFLKSHDV